MNLPAWTSTNCAWRMAWLLAWLLGPSLSPLMGGELENAPERGTDGGTAGAPRGDDAQSGAAKGHLREGAQVVERVGTFRLTGERVTFQSSDDTLRCDVLENLALERIARLLKESREPVQFRVSGTMTEYLGRNFLLISRAVVKGRTPTEPDYRAQRGGAQTAQVD